MIEGKSLKRGIFKAIRWLISHSEFGRVIPVTLNASSSFLLRWTSQRPLMGTVRLINCIRGNDSVPVIYINTLSRVRPILSSRKHLIFWVTSQKTGHQFVLSPGIFCGYGWPIQISKQFNDYWKAKGCWPKQSYTMSKLSRGSMGYGVEKGKRRRRREGACTHVW